MIAIVSGGGGQPSQVYNLQVAYRVPGTVPIPKLKVTDGRGNPLVINGVPVSFKPSSCQPGRCKVDRLFPAPAGQRWIQFESVEPIPPDGLDSSRLDVYVEVEFPASQLGTLSDEILAGSCSAVGLTGKLTATWHSDDRDDRYLIPVTDFYGEMVAAQPLLMFMDGFEGGSTKGWGVTVQPPAETP